MSLYVRPGEKIIVPEVVVDSGVAGVGAAAVVVAHHTQPVVVIVLRILSQLPLRPRRGGGELEIVQIPAWVILRVLPVMISLLQCSPEGDEAAEDDDNNDDDNDCDHGPGGLG